MLSHHVLDSLAVLPWITGSTLLDVGSGAGLPGLPLALARQDMRITLLDASQKKTAFLQQAVIELALANAEVVCERVESWNTPRRFELVVARAFASITALIESCGRLVAAGGALGAMKGRYPEDELAALPRGWRVAQAVKITVPGLTGERHWIRIEAVPGER